MFIKTFKTVECGGVIAVKADVVKVANDAAIDVVVNDEQTKHYFCNSSQVVVQNSFMRRGKKLRLLMMLMMLLLLLRQVLLVKQLFFEFSLDAIENGVGRAIGTDDLRLWIFRCRTLCRRMFRRQIDF
jgi:hypothetical protein